MKKLPQCLYVTLMNQGTDSEYLYATTHKDDALFDDGQLIGTYYQNELSRLEIKHDLHQVIQTKPKNKG